MFDNRPSLTILAFILTLSTVAFLINRLINYTKKNRNNLPSGFHYKKAQQNVEKKDYVNAFSYYTKAIAIEQLSVYYAERGKVREALKDFIRAIDDYSVAIRISPNEPNFWNFRANVFYENGDITSACRDWEHASALGLAHAKEMLDKHSAERKGIKTKQDSIYPKLYCKKGNSLNTNVLIGTVWEMCYFETDKKINEIEFQTENKLKISDDPNSRHLWLLIGNVVTLVFDMLGVAHFYYGTLDVNFFSGIASNDLGAVWRFEGKLISVKTIYISPELKTNDFTIQHGFSGRLNWAETKRLSTSMNEGNSPSQNNQSSLVKKSTPNSYHEKTNQLEFKNVLIENNISSLYHFTSKFNIKSVKEQGGLFSWQYCQKHNISIPYAGGDELSHSLDRRHGVENYVRLSFTRNHPMMYLALNQGRIPNPVILEIDPEVIFLEGTKFANKNATRNDVKLGSELEDFKHIRFDIVKQNNHFDLLEEEKPYYQAEVLVFEKIPIEFIKNINDQ